MILLLTTLPFLGAVGCYLVPSERFRRWALPSVGAAHLGLVVAVAAGAPQGGGAWFRLDPLGLWTLAVVSVLFFACFLYAPAYLRLRRDWGTRVFASCSLLLLTCLTLVTVSRHLGCLWVAMELTTLVSAPMVYFNHNARSVEAAWKYLLICSVGIALALLGTFFLAAASLAPGGGGTLLLDRLMFSAGDLSKPWLHAAFAALLVGYGTKMGLAPLHTWKPDAYGEAPGMVGALLAGGVTSGAFLALMRVAGVLRAAGEGAYVSRWLIVFGLLSMGVGAASLLRQKDFKRMLAYSSVEHMGLMALGAGLGGVALFGALLHLANNAWAKGAFFLTAGNIHRSYGSHTIDGVSGARRRLPWSGWIFLIAFLALVGTPIFGPFRSEFAVLTGAFEGGRWGLGALYLVLLFVAFVGMGRTVLAVTEGKPADPPERPPYRDTLALVLPPALLLGLLLWIGLWMPEELTRWIQNAADAWGGAR